MKKTKSMKYIKGRNAFTIVELVIVIAVIAILAAVLIPTFSSIVSEAKKSQALQEAKSDWTSLTPYIQADYRNFVGTFETVNGWFYDFDDEVAKHHIGTDYTVTYDGEVFTVLEYDASTNTLLDDSIHITQEGTGMVVDWD